ncbi:diaminopimelate decarboxylase [Streptomyces sp. NPDC005480]|uniref:diaminopimelate decarboxylase n=1 Tax=Streptomyces sp. NPDC005480 TaxID=3154880 RepID=UPI0033A95B8C
MAVTTVAAAIPAQSPDDLSVWPATTVRGPHGDPTVSGVELVDVAERFGTPVHVLDETDVRARCRAYRSAFPGADVLYAAKAFLCRAMVHWVHEEGLGLDVCSAGELELAVVAGLPPERIVFHGNAKSPDDLRAALRHGVGRIVVDSTSEIARLAAYVPRGTRQRVMARVVPGVAAGGRAASRTGTDDRKSGLSIADGSAMHAVTRLVEQPGLELTGLHCHIGSQIDTVKPYVIAVRHLVGLMARIRDRHGIALPELDIGGGHAVAHRPGDHPLDVPELARRVRRELADACAQSDLPVARLAVEPGRAVVARAGVALYRVLAVRRTGARVFVAVDGGMSDSPRAAFHGIRRVPRLVGRRSTAAERPVTVVGRHCEAGDVLASEVPLPDDVRPGDLLAVPVAGAYHLVGRPPVVAVADGRARLLVPREPAEDVRSRDAGL